MIRLRKVARRKMAAAAFLALCFIFGTTSVSSASDIYVAQQPSGSANGHSCAEAFPYTFFNNYLNWGTLPGQIGPGTTVHLCGAITTFNGSSYDYLTFHGSGTPNNPIRLYWEKGAKIRVPSCGASACVKFSGRNNLVFDGGGPGNGIIEATDNGTGLGHQDGGSGFAGNPCDQCEFKYLRIQNLYVHAAPVPIVDIVGNGSTATVTCQTNCGYSAGQAIGIRGNPVIGFNTAPYPSPTSITVVTASPKMFTFESNTRGTGRGGEASDIAGGGVGVATGGRGVRIHNSTCSDTRWCFVAGATNGGSVEMASLKAWHTDHCFVVGNNMPNVRMQAIKIHDSECFDLANWDTGIATSGSNIFHHDGIHIFLIGGTYSVDPMLIYNNYFHGNWGANPTAQVYLQGDIPSHYVFNNLFIDENGKGALQYEFYPIQASGKERCYLFNNTFYTVRSNNFTHLAIRGCPNTMFTNNIVINGARALSFSDQFDDFNWMRNGLESNVYWGIQGVGSPGAWIWQHYVNRKQPQTVVWTADFRHWVEVLEAQAPWSGSDEHSSLEDPKLDSTFHPVLGSSAIGHGVPLNNVVPSEASFDRAGCPRPFNAPWDIGAYNYRSTDSAAHDVPGQGHCD